MKNYQTRVNVWTRAIFNPQSPVDMSETTIYIEYRGQKYRFTVEAFCSLIGCTPEELRENGDISNTCRDRFDEWAERLVHATLVLAAE